MPLSDVDKGYLWDMLEACEDIHDFTADIGFYEFEKS